MRQHHGRWWEVHTIMSVLLFLFDVYRMCVHVCVHVCVCVCVCVCVWLCRASLIQLHTPSIASSPAIGASYSSPCAFSYLAYTLTLTPSPSHPHPHTLTLTLAYQLSHLAPTHTNSSHTFAPTRYTCTHYIPISLGHFHSLTKC